MRGAPLLRASLSIDGMDSSRSFCGIIVPS